MPIFCIYDSWSEKLGWAMSKWRPGGCPGAQGGQADSQGATLARTHIDTYLGK